jgi:non-ribosomal peptide synthetase component F
MECSRVQCCGGSGRGGAGGGGGGGGGRDGGGGHGGGGRGGGGGGGGGGCGSSGGSSACLPCTSILLLVLTQLRCAPNAQQVEWFTPPTIALDPSSSAPFHRWYPDGVINLCHNALDRHVASGRGEQTAISYISTVGGESRDISYSELLKDVAKFAGNMKALGIERGDRVVIYMPMIPEAAVAMLACTRIGAIHSVVFGGFAPAELAVRINHTAPKLVIAATCGLEGKKGALAYMPLVNRALELSTVKVPHVVVKQRRERAAASVTYNLRQGRDHDFDTFLSEGKEAPCEKLSANAPLYSIYTSGTTGDPKARTQQHTRDTHSTLPCFHCYTCA